MRGISRIRVLNLLQSVAEMDHVCPTHGYGACSHASHNSQPYGSQSSHNIPDKTGSGLLFPQASSQEKEYAFEMASSNLRYGRGVTQEVGMDLNFFQASKVLIVTDKTISKFPILTQILTSCLAHGVEFDVYSDTKVEPTDASLIHAVQFALSKPLNHYQAFVAVGGGSVMDTCKVVNLISSLPPDQGRPMDPHGDVDSVRNCLMRFVNSPIGKGEPVAHTLKPLIAIPTTSGTGSETTGVAIFDLLHMKAKTGIAHRHLRPVLGLIDPNHAQLQPRTVATFSGFDVFCHALESFTALPYHERRPRPATPLLRPAYQGSNPLSDVWARYTLAILAKYFVRAVEQPEDAEARGAMHLASSCAGMGFGNAGVHLAHAMSYPVSGLAHGLSFRPPVGDYPHQTAWSHEGKQEGFIPHGLSVVINAPAVFRYTAPFCPERHLEAAKLLQPDGDFSRVKLEDAGRALVDVILRYMSRLGIPDGLQSFGFNSAHLEDLIEGVLPQHRITKLAPGPPLAREDVHTLFENSMKIY